MVTKSLNRHHETLTCSNHRVGPPPVPGLPAATCIGARQRGRADGPWRKRIALGLSRQDLETAAATYAAGFLAMITFIA